MLRIKICGITQPDQGVEIAQLGATALGFICATKSPRFVTPEQIGAIVDALPLNAAGTYTVDRIGVFVNADLATIEQTVNLGRLNGVQLHGNESPDVCAQVRQALPDIELIKAFRIRSSEDLSAIAAYEPVINALLLDAYHPHLFGGTGKTLDWQTLQTFRPSRPWFLAGGLRPDNVQAALRQLSPSGIDLSSGVERSPGDKDLVKVANLFEQLKPALVD
ncbi:MAG: phosphoribosylanthranilate isomerase [Thainema sp.]